MVFNRDEYIDSVVDEAVMFLDERFECARCGSEESSWELPAHVSQPLDRDSPSALCIFCWAEWAADSWESVEAAKELVEALKGRHRDMHASGQ